MNNLDAHNQNISNLQLTINKASLLVIGGAMCVCYIFMKRTCCFGHVVLGEFCKFGRKLCVLN